MFSLLTLYAPQKFLKHTSSSALVCCVISLSDTIDIPIILCLFLSAGMCVSWPSLLASEVPIKHFTGKSCKICCFGSFGSILTVLLFLIFAICGVCNEVPMVSVPLGFEISGFDRGKTWVSKNGVFAFGFLERSGDDVDGFAVGIRYNLGSNKAGNVPVWTVGGGLKVSMNSTFRLHIDGRLVLLETTGIVVWSSDTSSLGVQKASLLDNGNLVLMDSGDKVLWQSFDRPTNTLLPGQSLQFPQTLRAPSTNSISSYYSLVIRPSGELALVWEHNVTYWSSQLSFPDAVKEARFDSNGVLGLYDSTNKVVWSVSSKDFEDHLINFRHLRIDQDGNLRIYSWNKDVSSWTPGWQAVEDQCNVFGSCGLYSVCGYNSTGTVCECLYSDSFDLESGDSVVDSSGSWCKKMVDLGNCKLRTSMVTLKQTVLYGMYPPHDVNIMLSEKACKDYCSNDTTCIAVTSKNDGSGLCTIKRTNFISGYNKPSVPATSFLKVCFVPQAASAGGANPHRNAGTIIVSLPGPAGLRARGGSSKKFLGAIAFIVLVTVSVILTFEVFVFWFIYRRRRLSDQLKKPFGKDAWMNANFSGLIRLSFDEIKELTNNFAGQLGPSVFEGTLPNKTPVVAKLVNDVFVSEKEFRVAVSTLGGMHHRNLVPLKGYCFETNHKILLYEYISNGSLDKWLFEINRDQNEGNWQQRLDIGLGVARALAYLHTECQQCIAHGNLKLENVLLDENLVPRVTDFGVHSLFQRAAASSSESPYERDIYMLGKLLLQIVTSKRESVGGSVQQIMDGLNQEQRFLDSEDLRGVEKVVRIALWCMQLQPFLRPSIGEVVKVLEGTLSVDRPPSASNFRDRSHKEEGVSLEIEVER